MKRESHKASPSASPRTAAALIIGNELLTGKVQDTNVASLASELFTLGIVLRRVVFCPDEVAGVARELNALRSEHDLVFTSGGVGPTHDDVTLPGVAEAFGRPLIRSESLAELLREAYGERLTTSHLRMAEVPEGCRLVTGSRSRWPVLLMGNVFVLPGLPEVFEMKLPIIREHLGADVPFISRAVHTRSDEGDLAELLERLCREHPSVAIGSYPRWGEDPRVVLTFDGRDAEAVERAIEGLHAALPADQILQEGR